MQQQQQVPVWADPNIGILFIIAAMTFVMCGVLVNQGVGPMPISLIGVLGAGAVGLIILGIIAYRRNDIIFGTAAMVFGALICGGGLFVMGGAFAGWPELGGWFFLSIAIMLFLFLPAIARVNALLFFAIAELVVAIALLAAYCWGGPVAPGTSGLATAGGWMLLVFGIVALYAGGAMLTNTIWAREVLPMGPPLTK
jgi:hypothetical protein